MRSKYDFTKRMAKKVRAQLRLRPDAPVLYAKMATQFQLLARDQHGAVSRDCHRCILAKGLKRITGREALVFNRSVVRVETEKGVELARIYALGFNSAKLVYAFDRRGKPIGDDIVTLLAWPSSWYPEERARAKGVRTIARRKSPSHSRVSRPNINQLGDA